MNNDFLFSNSWMDAFMMRREMRSFERETSRKVHASWGKTGTILWPAKFETVLNSIYRFCGARPVDFFVN